MNPIESFFDQLAPNWDQVESHTETEKRFLLEKASILSGDHVLDIACGTGVLTELIHTYSQEKVVGIDISKNMIDIATQKYADKPWASFERNNFLDYNPEYPFDLAILYNAYPHFLEPLDLSKKMSSVLKPNGRFAILHSLGRKELADHHSGIAKNFSRELNPPDLEASYFTNYFNILDSGESDHFFYIIGQKK